MEQRQSLFIYDRREMGILLLLGLMIAIFAFTLGVHLGKRVGLKVVTAPVPEPAPVTTVADTVPPPEEIADQARGAEKSVDQSLRDTLEKEVTKTGVRLDTPVPVDFPQKTIAEKHDAHGAAKPSGHAEKLAPISGDTHRAPPAEELPVPEASFTLQVGSHLTMDEAKQQIDAIEVHGLKPYVRAVDLHGKGKWYRVFVGGYATKDEALKTGTRLRSQKIVRSFIVAKVADSE